MRQGWAVLGVMFFGIVANSQQIESVHAVVQCESEKGIHLEIAAMSPGNSYFARILQTSQSVSPSAVAPSRFYEGQDDNPLAAVGLNRLLDPIEVMKSNHGVTQEWTGHEFKLTIGLESFVPMAMRAPHPSHLDAQLTNGEHLITDLKCVSDE